MTSPAPQQISAARIDPDKECIKAVFCVRNELFRLPFFLEYYRKLGVEEFFAIDNGSTDGTKEYLLEQKDLNVFYTEQTYKSSNAGRDWTFQLANEYCLGNWCLTLDVDEFFVFPLIEHSNLLQLTQYLEHSNYEGMLSIFLDFYSDEPLSQAIYKSGRSPFEVCAYFDNPSSYTCYAREIFPHIEIKGGPRQRIFWAGEDPKTGPSMRKLVLIKWKEGFHYTHSAHSCTPVKLADITSVVAHFKLMSHFKDYAREEVERNTRIANSVDWKVYSKKLESQDVTFYAPEISIKYEDSNTLLNSRHMSCSNAYYEFVRLQRDDHPAAGNPQNTMLARKELDHLSDSAAVDYGHVIRVWPAVSMFSKEFKEEAGIQQQLMRFEKDIRDAADSKIWRFSYALRKLASNLGMTDQRSLTEENFYNQTLHSRFTFTYKSIWWDVLGPLRVVAKVIRRIKRTSN